MVSRTGLGYESGNPRCCGCGSMRRESGLRRAAARFPILLSTGCGYSRGRRRGGVSAVSVLSGRRTADGSGSRPRRRRNRGGSRPCEEKTHRARRRWSRRLFRRLVSAGARLGRLSAGRVRPESGEAAVQAALASCAEAHGAGSALFCF